MKKNIKLIDRDKLFIALENLADSISNALESEGVRMAIDVLAQQPDIFVPDNKVELELSEQRIWELENDIRNLQNENDILRREAMVL